MWHFRLSLDQERGSGTPAHPSLSLVPRLAPGFVPGAFSCAGLRRAVLAGGLPVRAMAEICDKGAPRWSPGSGPVT